MKNEQQKNRLTRRLQTTALAVMLFAALLPPLSAQARTSTANNLPALEQFIEQVANGDGETLRGVYIPLALALPVVQQPPRQENYISPMNAALTEFRMARKAGSIGLLAHNYLAGRNFFLIEIGSPIMLVYGNRRVETFIVEDIRKYEELYNGRYKDLETLEDYGIREVFQKMYGSPRHLTLQTCIEKDGNWNWGRLFIIALPQGAEEQEVAPPPPPPPPAFSKQVLGWPLMQRFDQNLKPAYRSNTRFPK